MCLLRHGIVPVLAFACGMVQVAFCLAQDVPAAGPANRPGRAGATLRAYTRTSYYTSETQAQVVCEVKLSASEREMATLVARDGAGRPLAQAGALRAQTVLSFSLDGLPLGPHPVTVELRRGNGDLAVVREVSLVKRAPKPGCEWKIDRFDKVILNNGAPFFPFGIMISSRCTMEQEAMLKDVAAAGFNSVVRFGRTPFDQIEELLDMARRYSLYVVDFPRMWRFTPSDDDQPPKPEPGADWRKTAAAQFDWQMGRVYVPGMQRIMNHPNLMATYLWDEPQNNQDFAACILRLYNKFNELDGYHPMEVLYIPPIPEGDEFSRNCDILGTDIYWIPGGGKSATDNPVCMSRFTWQTRQRADRDLKIAWITPCAEQYSVTRLRLFVEREQRVQTYLALIHGAKGLLYFVYPFKHQTTYDTFVRLGREMKVLGPACAAPDVPQTVRYAPVECDPRKHVFPDVQVALKRNPAGGYILLAANWRKYPVDVAYRLTLPDQSDRPNTVRLLFDGKTTYRTEQGSFADSLAAMDTRAYVIQGAAELSAPVDIAVDVTAHPDETDASLAVKGIPQSGAPGRKNLLRNSGFEESQIPGMPDYYRDIRTPKTLLGYRQGDPRGDCGWSVATNCSYEGRSSLRLTDSRYSFFLFGVSPKLDEPTPFVFSAWVRSASPTNTFIRFYGPGTDRQRYPLTNDWKRISQVVTVQPEAPWSGHYFGFYTGATGTNNVWIDAMQFEKGRELTEYER